MTLKMGSALALGFHLPLRALALSVRAADPTSSPTRVIVIESVHTTSAMMPLGDFGQVILQAVPKLNGIVAI